MFPMPVLLSVMSVLPALPGIIWTVNSARSINEMDSVLRSKAEHFALTTAVREVSATDSPHVNVAVENC